MNKNKRLFIVENVITCLIKNLELLIEKGELIINKSEMFNKKGVLDFNKKRKK